MNKIPFLRWLLIVTLMTIVAMAGFLGGGLPLLLGQGMIGVAICSVTLALLLIITIKCGILTYQFTATDDMGKIKQIDISKDSIWFFADSCVKIGLMGTVVGFIIAISVLPSIDFTSIGNVQSLMVKMSSGLSVALYTTLVGIGSNMLLRMQALNLTQAISHSLLGDMDDDSK